MQSVAWEQTPLGPREAWPTSLNTIVSVILNSRHPMFLWWGEELIQIYNDAYVPSFGVGKHPTAMGQRGEDCWREIWPIIKPQIDGVMLRGEPSWNVDHLVPIWRNGRIEEVYWTYGYSPVYTEQGRVGGTLVVCTETTPRILAERRLGTIRALALELVRAPDASKMFGAMMAVLSDANRDVPFIAIYAGASAPLRRGLDAASAAAIDALVSQAAPGRHVLAEPIATGPWPEPVNEVLLMPLDGGRGIVFGLSPRLAFDAAYQAFLEQLVENLVVAQARARLDEERRNLLEKAPMAAALMSGPSHVFEIANPRYRAMVGRDVLGKPFAEAFPELRDSELISILGSVYRTGQPFVARELAVELRGDDGASAQHYFTFNVEPVKNTEGAVTALMAVAVDITDQVNARLVLERSHEERQGLLVAADSAARAKDEFLAMLGHELRNPLAPIITAVHLLKAKDKPEIRREREIIERQANHLVRLVDDLLDASRVAQGKIELKRTQLALSDVIASAVEMAAPLFEKKNHRLELDVPKTGLDLYADPMRLAQVIANLLTNAARYTPQGGRIALSARRVGDALQVRVEDNGIGIAPEHLTHLFSMFFQGPRRSDRAEGGLGLGLALAKSLIELHGGSVTASSPGPGLGSVFEISVPVATRAPETQSASAASAKRAAADPSARVLLVDDNRDLADMLAQLLEESGSSVWTAHDGPSALAIAREVKPGIAVIDIGLPVMDGYELAASMREALGSSAPRLIAMTGYGEAEDRERSQRAGFERHLVKPVDTKLLLGLLATRAN